MGPGEEGFLRLLGDEVDQAIGDQAGVGGIGPALASDAVDLEAAELGARVALEEGLARAAFLVRVAALCESLTPTQRAAFWISAVVADDVAHLVRRPILAQSSVVVVGGREPLRSLYVRRLREFLFDRVSPIEDDLAEAASALGALEIAGKRLFRSNRLDGSVRDESAP